MANETDRQYATQFGTVLSLTILAVGIFALAFSFNSKIQNDRFKTTVNPIVQELAEKIEATTLADLKAHVCTGNRMIVRPGCSFQCSVYDPAIDGMGVPPHGGSSPLREVRIRVYDDPANRNLINRNSRLIGTATITINPYARDIGEVYRITTERAN